jgi:hypothetical protein
MEMDRPHIEKTTNYYNQTGSFLELTGTRKRGRPKNTRRRDLKKDRSNISKSWRELEILTKYRRTCNAILTGLCPHGI